MGKSAADAGGGRRVRCKPDNGGGTGITRTQSQMWPVVSVPLKGKCRPQFLPPPPLTRSTLVCIVKFPLLPTQQLPLCLRHNLTQVLPTTDHLSGRDLKSPRTEVSRDRAFRSVEI